MLRKRKMKKTKRTVLTAILAALVLVSGYFFYSYFFSAKIELIKPLVVKVDILNIAKLDPVFAGDFLNQPPYVDLVERGRLPVTAERVGRPNPFRPISFNLPGL